MMESSIYIQLCVCEGECVCVCTCLLLNQQPESELSELGSAPVDSAAQSLVELELLLEPSVHPAHTHTHTHTK